MDESGAPDHQQRAKEPAVMVRGGGRQKKSAREKNRRKPPHVSQPPFPLQSKETTQWLLGEK
eukprot:13633473-Ditylum_brightwellii.AAC.1